MEDHRKALLAHNATILRIGALLKETFPSRRHISTFPFKKRRCPIENPEKPGQTCICYLFCDFGAIFIVYIIKKYLESSVELFYSIWTCNFSICLCERPKPNIFMISGFLRPVGTLIYGFVYGFEYTKSFQKNLRHMEHLFEILFL